MLLTMAASLLAAQPEPALPREAEYVLVEGPRGEMLRRVEADLARVAPPGMRLRRSRLSHAAMENCIDDRDLVDRADVCIRQLVPERTRGAPVIALWIDSQTISNVTGSRRHERYSLRCIGPRSIATAALGDGPDWESGFSRSRREEEMRSCLEKAATPRHANLLHRGRGAPLWRLPLAPFLPDNGGHARGLCCERVTIAVEQVRRTPARDRICLLRARVTEVESYYMFRRGDRVEVTTSCAGERLAGFRRVMAPDGLRPGSRARLHVNLDGEATFVEPF